MSLWVKSEPEGSGVSYGVPCRDVSEGHGRADIDAASWVVAAHDIRLVGSDCVEAAYRDIGIVKDAGGSIGDDPGECTEAAGYDFDSIEWAFF